MLKASAISKQLLKLANSNLNLLQRETLLDFIQQLFSDLAAGHSCSRVAEICQLLQFELKELQSLLQQSNLVAFYQAIPVNFEMKPFGYLSLESGDLVYISKYLVYELNIANKIKQLTGQSLAARNVNPNQYLHQLEQLSARENKPNFEQLSAIKRSCQQTFSIISGGPGTGKTTTVMLLLWTLYQMYGFDLKVRICAPTGKAAIRVRESIDNSIKDLASAADLGFTTECFEQLLTTSVSFGTIHKLLGYRPYQINFRHNQENPLRTEVLIIDESSMISLPLFSKLLMAIDPCCIRHVIFLGDYNQLSSVEEGYVFASLVNFVKNNQTLQIDEPPQSKSSILSELIKSNRNHGDVYKLAQAILHQDFNQLSNIIKDSPQVNLFKPQLGEILHKLINHTDSILLEYLNLAASLQINELDVKLLFQNYTRQTLLCLTNRGILGVDNLNIQLERQIKQKMESFKEWYNGRPIIILQNDYSLDVYNGDIGICICDGDVVNIIFENGRQFIPEVLPKYALAYAITIHKSQGSEYEQVNLVLPEQKSLIGDSSTERNAFLSRELVYTAITRARIQVNIFAELRTLEHAIQSNMQRHSGLLEFLG